MTREQAAARELISLYEGGTRITCEMENRNLKIESESGVVYWVDPDAKHIRRTDGFALDLTELETRISHPADFEPEPYDDPWPYDEAPPPPVRLATDNDWERVEDLKQSGRMERELEEYWHKRERGAA